MKNHLKDSQHWQPGKEKESSPLPEGYLSISEAWQVLREQVRARPDCPDEQTLCGYVDRMLWLKEPQKAQALKSHLNDCPVCRYDVKEIAACLPLTDRIRYVWRSHGNAVNAPLRWSWNAIFRFWHWLWTPIRAIRQLRFGTLSLLQIFAGVEAVIILLLCGFLLFHKYVAPRGHLHGVVKAALAEGFRDNAELLAQIATKRTMDVAEARSIKFVTLQAEGTEAYPYPTRGDRPSNPGCLAKGIHQFSDLRAEYTDYLNQWATILQKFGSGLVETSQIKDAIRVFEYLRQVNLNDEELLEHLLALGELYKMDNRHQESIPAYEQVIQINRRLNERNPNHKLDPRPFNYLGFSHFELGNFEKAREHFRQAIDINPKYAKAYYNLALTDKALADRGILSPAEGKGLYNQNFQRGLDLTLEAYQKEGDDNPRIPFTLAILYTEKGEMEKEALHYLERALQKERTYVVRAENERAFATFREASNPYHLKFTELLNRYRTPPPASSEKIEAISAPDTFYE